MKHHNIQQSSLVSYRLDQNKSSVKYSSSFLSFDLKSVLIYLTTLIDFNLSQGAGFILQNTLLKRHSKKKPAYKCVCSLENLISVAFALKGTELTLSLTKTKLIMSHNVTAEVLKIFSLDNSACGKYRTTGLIVLVGIHVLRGHPSETSPFRFSICFVREVHKDF